MKRLFPFLFFFLGLFQVIGSELDSLSDLLKQETNAVKRLDLYNTYIQKMIYVNPDTALILTDEALTLWKKTEFNELKKKQELIIGIYNNRGVIYKSKSEFDSALYYYEKSFENIEKDSFPMEVATNYNNRANIYYMQGQYPLAIELHLKGLSIREEIHDSNGVAMSFGNLALIYDKQDNHELALKNYSKSAAYFNQVGNKAGAAWIHLNISTILQEQKNMSGTFYHLSQSLILYRQIEHKRGITNCYINLATLYLDIVVNYIDSMPIIGFDSSNKVAALDSAESYLTESMDYHKISGNNWTLIFIYNRLGEICRYKNLNGQAIQYYTEALQYGEASGALKEISNTYEGLSETYIQMSNFEKALQSYKKMAEIKDSLFNASKSKEIGKLEATYEMEKKQAEEKRIENEKLKIENEKRERRDNLQYSGIFVFVLLLFAAVFMSGRFSMSEKVAEGLIFFTFLLFFEFCLVLLDPYIEDWSSGEPAWKLLFNAFLAAAIFPLHAFFESSLKKKLIR